MTLSLVDNLRPASRDQVKLNDRILRATLTSAEQTAKGNSTVLQWDMSGSASFAVTFSGDSTAVALEGSNDLVAWFTLDAQILGPNSAPVSFSSFYMENSASVGSIPTTNIAGNKQSRFMRVRSVTPSSSRNVAIAVSLSQIGFVPTRPTKHLSPEGTWSYVAASGGITNATPVTIKAAVNGYHRNLITRLQLDNSGATGTEVIVSDALASVVLWRGYLPPSGHQEATFDPPLRATPNASLTVTLSAASGAAVYANVQGLVGLA